MLHHRQRQATASKTLTRKCETEVAEALLGHAVLPSLEDAVLLFRLSMDPDQCTDGNPSRREVLCTEGQDHGCITGLTRLEEMVRGCTMTRFTIWTVIPDGDPLWTLMHTDDGPIAQAADRGVLNGGSGRVQEVHEEEEIGQGVHIPEEVLLEVGTRTDLAEEELMTHIDQGEQTRSPILEGGRIDEALKTETGAGTTALDDESEALHGEEMETGVTTSVGGIVQRESDRRGVVADGRLSDRYLRSSSILAT